MIRATRHLTRRDAAETPSARVVLAHGERHLRRKLLRLETGEEFLVDLPEPVMLRHGDFLALDDGTLVEVEAAVEELHAVAGRDALHFAELAWHLGNRHLPVEIEPGRILIQRDHVIRAMLEGLGAEVSRLRSLSNHPWRLSSDGGHSHGREAGQSAERTITALRAIRTMGINMPEGLTAPASADLDVAGLSGRRLRLQPRAGAGHFQDRLVRDRLRSDRWLTDLLAHGSAWNDAVLLAESWREERRGPAKPRSSPKHSGSRERHMETTLQGGAFLRRCGLAICANPQEPDTPYPVALGLARGPAVPTEFRALRLSSCFVSNLVQVALRLSRSGSGTASRLARWNRHPGLRSRARRSTLDDLGSATLCPTSTR